MQPRTAAHASFNSERDIPYNVNLWGLYATEASQGPFALVNALRAEAAAAGATEISITGSAVINQGLLNISPAVAGRLGLVFERISESTIMLRGLVAP